MAQRVPKRARRLARQGAAGQIGNGARDHHRQPRAGFGEHFLEREHRRLGVEGIEHRFDQDQIGVLNAQLAATERAYELDAERANREFWSPIVLIVGVLVALAIGSGLFFGVAGRPIANAIGEFMEVKRHANEPRPVQIGREWAIRYPDGTMVSARQMLTMEAGDDPQQPSIAIVENEYGDLVDELHPTVKLLKKSVEMLGANHPNHILSVGDAKKYLGISTSQWQLAKAPLVREALIRSQSGNVFAGQPSGTTLVRGQGYRSVGELVEALLAGDGPPAFYRATALPQPDSFIDQI